ncbi:hypothetical protein BKA70DRAFT_1264393 [Coprinopsis sp. MPI-PUGE-AT-0042]|nr:hypothetical protein BKA70DRAFT_1264393 [Coprinopsis sp. MPI-PUGE-AT-0042]
MAGLNDGMASLPNLPTDILLLIFNTLSVRELSAVSQTCSFFHDLISSYGWPMYIRRHPRPSYSVSNFFSESCPRSIVRYNHLTDQNWQESSFVARPLSCSWPAKQQPTLAINSKRLVIAAGATISCYSFTSGCQPGILDEGSIYLGEPHIQGRNITSVTFLGENVLLVAYQEGLVEIITLLPSTGPTPLAFTRRVFSGIIPDTDYVESFSASSTLLLSISSLGSALLCSLPSPGETDDAHEAHPASIVDLCDRGWKCYLSSSSGPTGSQDVSITSSHPTFAAFGTSGRIPLTVHSISPSQGLSPNPEFVLHTPKGVDTWHSQLERSRRRASSSPSPLKFGSGTTTPSSTPAPTFDWQTTSGLITDPRLTDRLPNLATYGITRAPLNSPWGASPQILVSGWFDGEVRIYDMRDSSSTCPRTIASSLATNGSLASRPTGEQFARPTFLKPVLSLHDRWQHEAIYTVGCGGGNGSYVAAGAARHGVVSFWDVRRGAGERLSNANTLPQETTDNFDSVEGYGQSVRKSGWSVHAPASTSDSSPVFDLIMESSRVFGVTDRKGFVLDFGPTPTVEQYPAVARSPEEGTSSSGHGSRNWGGNWRDRPVEGSANGIADPKKGSGGRGRGTKKGKQQSSMNGGPKGEAGEPDSNPVSFRVATYFHSDSGLRTIAG